ncbi:MAG: hypothetical protein ACI8ZM_002025 [Crocinitomix sp.]|jgi:hypothetical protein
MKFLTREDINTEKWNKRIEKDGLENVFSYTWYLDATAESWGALISGDDFTTVMPVAYTSKLGIKRMYQAPFTREYSIFGTDFDWNEALDFLTKEFKHISFRSGELGLTKMVENRQHQELKLTEEFPTLYRSNAKRLVKKGNKIFQFRLGTDPTPLIELFEATVAHKVEAVGTVEIENLKQLMRDAIQLGKGELIEVIEDGKLVASGFFLIDKKRITYLKGAALDDAKKAGAMYSLFNYAFERYQKNYDTFDFGGSDIEAVANFFRKFGATDRNYYNYTIDNSPLWFKTLKRLKG